MRFLFAFFGHFECNEDLHEAAGAADARACSMVREGVLLRFR